MSFNTFSCTLALSAYEGMVILADILHIQVVIREVVFFYILPLEPSVFALSILLRATFCKYHG